MQQLLELGIARPEFSYNSRYSSAGERRVKSLQSVWIPIYHFTITLLIISGFMRESVQILAIQVLSQQRISMHHEENCSQTVLVVVQHLHNMEQDLSECNITMFPLNCLLHQVCLPILMSITITLNNCFFFN